MPIITALTGATESHGAVIATIPAKAPFIVIDASGLPYIAQTNSIAAIEPSAAERLVFTKQHPDSIYRLL